MTDVRYGYYLSKSEVCGIISRTGEPVTAHTSAQGDFPWRAAGFLFLPNIFVKKKEKSNKKTRSRVRRRSQGFQKSTLRKLVFRRNGHFLMNALHLVALVRAATEETNYFRLPHISIRLPLYVVNVYLCIANIMSRKTISHTFIFSTNLCEHVEKHWRSQKDRGSGASQPTKIRTFGSTFANGDECKILLSHVVLP